MARSTPQLQNLSLPLLLESLAREMILIPDKAKKRVDRAFIKVNDRLSTFLTRNGSKMALVQYSLLVLVCALTACTNTAETTRHSSHRNQVISSTAYGSHTIASSNLSLKQTEKNNSNHFFENSATGSKGYINNVLARPKQSFTFTLQVPNQPSLYGNTSNRTIPFAGLIIYPTTKTNKNKNYSLPNKLKLPRMDRINEPPLLPTNQKFPLLVLSHGLASHPSDYFELELAKFFASHGFIVLSLFHGDNRFPGLLDHPENKLEQFAMRPLAIKKALDTLLSDSQFSEHINQEQIGGIGVSFGGATLFALSGGKVSGWKKEPTINTEQDSRIKASVGISPFFGSRYIPMFGTNGQGGSYLKQPYMAISGTSDSVALWKRSVNVISKAAEQQDAFLIGMEKAQHSLKEGEANDARTWALLFLKSYLLSSTKDQKTLSRLRYARGSGKDFMAIEPAQD